MARLSDTYERLFSEFRHEEGEMADGQPDRQQNFIQAARRIIAFEHENELPRLKELVVAHGSAVAKIDAGRQKLERLERAIGNQELYIAGRFADNDVVGDTLDLIAWRKSHLLGTKAVKSLIAQAAELETELRAF